MKKNEVINDLFGKEIVSREYRTVVLRFQFGIGRNFPKTRCINAPKMTN